MIKSHYIHCICFCNMSFFVGKILHLFCFNILCSKLVLQPSSTRSRQLRPGCRGSNWARSSSSRPFNDSRTSFRTWTSSQLCPPFQDSGPGSWPCSRLSRKENTQFLRNRNWPNWKITWAGKNRNNNSQIWNFLKR